jgi:hypothetical protein
MIRILLSILFIQNFRGGFLKKQEGDDTYVNDIPGIILIAASVIATCSVMIKIRRAKMQIEDAVFWVLFSFLLIILALFPPVLFFFTGLLKMQSPANLLFLIIIFLLFAKVFSMSVKLSRTGRNDQDADAGDCAGKGKRRREKIIPEGRETII